MSRLLHVSFKSIITSIVIFTQVKFILLLVVIPVGLHSIILFDIEVHRNIRIIKASIQPKQLLSNIEKKALIVMF